MFRDLLRSDRPVVVDPLPGVDGTMTLPRVAVSVRAGDEVLGSIWAVVPEPLSPERLGALTDSAKLVALHLLRVRAGADPCPPRPRTVTTISSAAAIRVPGRPNHVPNGWSAEYTCTA